MDKGTLLGKLGELLLEKWATEAHLTINKATSDREGWDHLVEWPLPTRSDSAPLDRQGSPLQCFIQVKATGGAKRRAVTLKNWTKLSRSLLPAFFLILEFGADNECKAAYVVHIWEDEIAKVLQRLRELSSTIPAKPLGKQTLDLTWGERHRLPTVSAAALRERIEEYVSPYEGYANRKAELLRRLGNGGREGVVSVVVPEEYQSKSPQDLIDDLALGILDEVATSGGELWDVRFGIRAEPSDKFNTVGKIVRSPDAGKRGVLVFSRAHRSAVLDCKAYAAIRDLENRQGRVRFETQFMTILMDLSRHDISMHFSLPAYRETISIDQWSELASAIQLLNDTNSGDPNIEFVFNEWKLGTLVADDVRLPDVDLELAELARCATRVVANAGRRGVVKCSAEHLLTQKQELKMLDDLSRGGLPNGFITLSPSVAESGAQLCMPIAVPIWFEDVLILTPCLHFGTAEMAAINGEAGLWMHVESSRVLDAIVFKGQRSLPAEEHKQILERSAAQHATKAVVVRWWEQDGEPAENGA